MIAVLRSSMAVLCSLCTFAFAQQATRPTLQKTAGSPIAIGTDGALNAVGGFDFTGDGKEDLLTIGFGPSGTSEVRINPGNGAGGFANGGTASLGQVAVSVTEDNLAAGYLYPAEALGDDPRPAAAAIAGGALRLFKSGFSGLGSLSEQTAPTFSGPLRSVAIADLDGDGRDDLVVTGRITTPTARGAVYVVLNSAGGLGSPVELSSPGAEAGKLAVGDVNGDGRVDIVVCNPTDNCAKIYLATSPGQFGSAPVTIDTAGGSYGDTRPQAVAIGDLLPTAGKEMVFWNTCGDNGDPNRFIQFAIIKHTGGGIFEKDAGLGFSEHPAAGNKIGDIALGDFNGDGQLDIVGTDPVQFPGGLVVVPVKLDQSGHFDLANSPMFEVATTETPDNIAVGNANGDVFSGGSRPRLDVFITHLGTDANHTVDVFLNAESTTPPVPPGTPYITTTEWPQLGGELAATGASGPLRFTAVVDGRTTSVLPSGQSLSSLGEVVGVTANGTYSITVRVTAGRKFSEKTFTFTANNVAALTPGAIAWWPGEDAGSDVVGGNTALGLAEPTYGEGKVGRAFSFDGVDDFLYASDGAGQFDVRSNLTIEGWVKPAADSTGVRTIVAKHDSADEDLTFSLRVEANGKLSFVSQNTFDRRPTILSSSLEKIPSGEWTHVAARLRGVELALFINGKKAITKTVPPTYLPPSTAGQAVTIGATCTSPTGARANFWKGEIDELTIYHRALKDVEIDLIAKVGSAGKDRSDVAREFSTTHPQPSGALWRYGSMPSGTVNPANFSPFPELNVNDPALDVWLTNTAGGPQVRHNRLATTRSVGTGANEIRYAPGMVAQRTGSDGSYSVVRWTAPEAGRYAVAATWRCINAAGTSSGVRVYHNANSLFSTTGSNQFLGSGVSFTGTVDAAAGDTVDFLLAQNFVTDDTTSLFASVTLLPEEFEPVAKPEVDDLDYDQPLQTGKVWSFRARQTDSDDHEGRMTVKLQYSATPGVPGSWQYVPDSFFTRVSTLGWRLNINSLPVGSFAFRIATNVRGESTVFSDPTQIFNIGTATTILQFEAREQVPASNPTGATTHLDDTITYRFTVRNAGGLAGDNVSLRVGVPAGTKKLKFTKGGKAKSKRDPFGGPPLNFIVWSLGDLAPSPLDDAKTYELTVQVVESRATILQGDFALVTGDPLSPDQIIQPTPFLTATVVNPIDIVAVADDPTPDWGGFVEFTVTLTNKGSTRARKAQLDLAAPEGMFLPVSNQLMTFLDATGQPTGAPTDADTRKAAKFKKGLNPQRDDDSRSDGKMVALFYLGGMEPGAVQKARVRMQVQHGYYNHLVSGSPTIRAEDFSASWLSKANLLVSAKAAPVDLTVNVVPSAPRPQIGFFMSQIAADEVIKPGSTEANSRRVVAVTSPTGRSKRGFQIPGTSPARYSDEIYYTAKFENSGAVQADFVNAQLSIPEHTTFKTGSLKVDGVAATPVFGDVFGQPVVAVRLPAIAARGVSGAARIVEYAVTVDDNLPIGTAIENVSGFLTSRDNYYVIGGIFLPAQLQAEVVRPATMDYYPYGQEISAGTTTTDIFVSYQNSGGLAAEGVHIEYTVPLGLLFQSAEYIDLGPVAPGIVNQRTIDKPTVGQRGTVRFNVGTVPAPRIVKNKLQPGGGFVHIRCTVDAANIAQAISGDPNFGTPDDAFALKHLFHSYEDQPAPALGERVVRGGPQPGDIRYALRTIASQNANAQALAKTFVAMTAPVAIAETDELQYTIVWGNVGNTTAGIGGLRVPIPDGTEYVAGSLTDGVCTTGNANDIADGHYNAPGEVVGLPENGSITWITNSPPHSSKTATFRVRLKAGFTGPVVAKGGRLGLDQSGVRFLRDLSTAVLAAGTTFEEQKAAVFKTVVGQPADSAATDEAAQASFSNALSQFSPQSLNITIDGGDYIKVETTGVVVIPLGGGNLVAAGGGNLIGQDGSTLVAAGGGNLVAAGGGNLVKVDVGAGLITGTALYSQIPSLVAAGGLNLVNNGSGSLLEKRGVLVGTAPASLVGNDGASLVGMDGGTLGQFRLTGLVGQDGSTFFPANGGAPIALPNVGADLVAAGGGNLVAAGGGNLVAAGGLNLVAAGGLNLVAAGGGNLVAAGGLNLVAAGGLNLVAAGGGNLIGDNSAALVAAGGGNLGAQANGRLVAAGGGNIVQGSNGMLPSGQ